MKLQKINKSRLTLVHNPYYISYSSNVLKAIYLAIHKGLLTKFGIDSKLIEDYKCQKGLIPIWVLEAACILNKTDIKIPIEFQNVWYCLHNSKLIRKQPTGRIFNTKVNFTPCYIKWDEKLKSLLDESMEKLSMSKKEFSSFCGYKPRRIRYYQKKIPITIILKMCQILDLNVWTLLEGYEMIGQTSKIGGIRINDNKKCVDLMKLLIWLRTEGHIELGSTHIEINQKYNDRSLFSLKNLFIKKFSLSENSFYLGLGKRGEKRLIISSSSLRQLLCLKYNFPLGYKSCSLKRLDFSNCSQNDYEQIFPSFIETEGSLSYNYTRNKKKKLPKFEFIVKDKSIALDCIQILIKMGYNPLHYYNQNLFKVGLYNSKEVIDLINRTKEHFFDTKKLIRLKEVCTSGIGL